jgi:hypothetical protein
LAQSVDRIVAFHSEISIAKDRTQIVHEKFEVDNVAGAFDDGLRRRFGVAPAGPNRIKASSIESVSAKVDEVDGAIQIKRDNDGIEVHVMPPTNPWARGSHTVELHYIAKHQFRVYDGYDGLDKNISGVWPVPIEKADVQLFFPDGWPPLSNVGAYTGTSNIYKRDCVRTELPLGVKFETTHSLEPGTTLFISATFTGRGHFVSNVKEDGWKAYFENHPQRKPWAYFFAALIVVIAIGFAVLRIPAVQNARPSPHSLAVLVSVIATVLSGVSMGVFSPYAGMPGAGVGLIILFFLSQRPDSGGGSILFALLLGVGTNLVFYYFVALGTRHLWLRFTNRGTTAGRAR